MSSVLAVCPSRDRADECSAMIDSAMKTRIRESTSVAIYVDDDQDGLYTFALDQWKPSVYVLNRGRLTKRYEVDGSPVKMVIGPRTGPVHSANTLIHHFRDPFTIYGMVPDDSKFMTSGWDGMVGGILSRLEPHVAAAAHNGGEYVNFPWVNRAWIEAVGWYYYPNNFHHCCDTIVEVLGECANAITYLDPSEFSMHHDLMHTFNRDKWDADVNGLHAWLVGERRELVRRIRERIRDASQ